MTVIGTNISALRAANASNAASMSLQTSMERLSTGKRINSAKDDAAGLAIASRMTSAVRSMSVAIRNANDGISLAQTAEGAMGEVTNMLQRMKELSTQAANGTLKDGDRTTLQAEMKQLIAEVGNISKTTNFNGVNLLDGKTSDITLQTGINSGETIGMSMINMSVAKLGLQTGVDGPVVGGAAGNTALAKNTLQINGVWIDASDNGTADDATDDATIAAKVDAINAKTSETGVTATAGTTVTVAIDTTKIAGNFSVTGKSGTATDYDVASYLNDDGDAVVTADLVEAINGDAETTGISAELDDDGNIVLTSADGDIGLHSDTADMITSAQQTGGTAVTTSFDEADADADADTAGGGNADDFVGVNFKANQVNLTASAGKTIIVAGDAAALTSVGITATDAPGSDLSIGTQDDAAAALAVIDAALDSISAGRGDLGAAQNRLQSTVNNLTTTSANLDESRSRIEDTDFSSETTNLAKAQILAQASTAMLAQANQSQQNVLSLLR